MPRDNRPSTLADESKQKKFNEQSDAIFILDIILYIVGLEFIFILSNLLHA